MGHWLRSLSYLTLLGFPLAVLGTRLQLFHFRAGFVGLRYTVFLALAIVLIGLVVFFWRRKTHPSDAKAARWAVFICLLPLLGIGSQLVIASSVPSIHNISTDTVNPPDFVEIVKIRSDQDNSLEYNIDQLAKLQQQAYPEVKTLFTTLTKVAALRKTITVAEKLGWELVNQDAAAGIVEATQTSTLWGFKDDIVIRVREREDGTAIDLRSVSRVGRSDLGVNAKRIRKFLTAFQQKPI